jgi:integrase
MRGVYEHPPGSGVWWIHYYAYGKRHRERVGRKSDAQDLYRDRKADARRGRKLPVLQNSKVVTISELIDDVLEYTADHKDKRSYISKGEIVRADLGTRPAAELTPQEIQRYLRGRTKTPATHNRYKAFLSLCYKQGIFNNKISVNPARLVRQRKEEGGRKRFLSREEYERLLAAILKLSPEHADDFIASVHSGMRLSEQYTVDWSQVFLDQGTIELSKTKNGMQRTVHLNDDVLAAVRRLHTKPHRKHDRVFSLTGNTMTTKDWFLPCLAEAEITAYTWHCNRHTFCSWLAMAGATIKEIQEAAGHKTVSISAQYSHLSPPHVQSVVHRISTRQEGERTEEVA